MKYKHNKNLTQLAQNLRNNMTKEERHLWYDFLRYHPIKFIRQKVIGNYIVDFYCPTAKIVIEIDGSQHFEEEIIANDNARTEFLQKYGLSIIRFTNKDINNSFTSVCESINILLNNLGFSERQEY